ncbi:hypothetical protein [Novosphingobium sp. B 225]|uniref:hypothetical protein n=1 Tax=Novosphingobium sp. B 225 TaxID=1961849 RepID=UPI000B4B5A52|nr:hypothetical protein [Novosphingobium sp. B 225]
MRNKVMTLLAALALTPAGLAQAAPVAPVAPVAPQQVDWGTLPDILESIPQPPNRVHDAIGYERGLGPRIEQLEQRIDAFEARLDYLTDEADSPTVQRELQLASEQLEAARRRYMATLGTAGDDRETARARRTPRGTAPPVNVAAANSAVGRFAFQVSGRALAEERAVEGFSDDWKKKDDLCGDDEDCVRSEETKYWGNVARYKEGQYPGIKAEWLALADQAYRLSDGIGRYTAQAHTPARAQLQIERLATLQPLRVLLLATGTLFSETRKRWEEADNIERLLTQYIPGH